MPVTSKTCCDPEPANMEGSLKNRILSRIRLHPQRVKHQAKIFHVEVDGILIGTLMEDQEFILPEDARSVTLRDENQTARAHILTEQDIQKILFDQDRLSLTIKKEGGKKRLLVEPFLGQ